MGRYEGMKGNLLLCYTQDFASTIGKKIGIG